MPRAGKDVIVALKPEQLKVVAHAPGPRRVLNLTALATGMREAELAGLAWEHVDLGEGLVRVVRQLKKGKEVAFKPPKKGSKRVVPLHDVARQALRELFASCSPSPTDPVFPVASAKGTCSFGHQTSAGRFRERTW